MGELPQALRAQAGHAYILEGAGRLEHGRAFAKRLNCLEVQQDGQNGPCGLCLSCRIFESGNHPDIFFVTGTKATGIGVDDVREQIVLPMATQPFKYRYKIFVVDKAETLTPAAQNALLKTIEEPAPYGVFLFLAAHTHNLLPTLLSRCVLVKLGETAPVPDDDIQELAEEIVGTVAGLDIYETMALYRRIEPYKESRESARQLLDMLYLAYGRRITNAAANGESPKALWFTSLDAISYTKQVLSQNGNFQLAMELMLLKLNGKVK